MTNCPGVEVEPGVYSGCGGGWDCPTCCGGAPPDLHPAVQVLQRDEIGEADYAVAMRALIDAATERDALRVENARLRRVLAAAREYERTETGEDLWRLRYAMADVEAKP